jgi:hypothetical protein
MTSPWEREYTAHLLELEFARVDDVKGRPKPVISCTLYRRAVWKKGRPKKAK